MPKTSKSIWDGEVPDSFKKHNPIHPNQAEIDRLRDIGLDHSHSFHGDGKIHSDCRFCLDLCHQINKELGQSARSVYDFGIQDPSCPPNLMDVYKILVKEEEEGIKITTPLSKEKLH